MWKLTSEAKNWEPLPGVPWRDLDDDEFRAAAKEYAEINGFGPRALQQSGFFEHVEDKPARGEAKAEGDK